MTLTIVGIVAVLGIGYVLYQRSQNSAAASQQAADAASSTDTGATDAAETGTLQTEISDLQGTGAQDQSADSKKSAQQAAEIKRLEAQIDTLQKDESKSGKHHTSKGSSNGTAGNVHSPSGGFGGGAGPPVKAGATRPSGNASSRHHTNATRRK